ncbi:MAG: tetratricopeptide repeat protein [Cyanobacteria bacterium P01_D01_bin.44]
MDTVVLEANQRLSHSRLWEMQRRFFEQRGIQAWSEGRVPHYVTSNPTIARAYGQVVLGFLRDWRAVSPQSEPTNAATPHLDPTQPVYIVELGAGSGRFAYHFLRQFTAMIDQSALGDVAFTYVITDLAEANLDFCRHHPKLQPFVEQGLLDFARFDAETAEHLHLLQADVTITAKTLKNPLMVLANYFFDCIPQDVFTMRNGQLYESLLTLRYPVTEPDLDDPELDEETFFEQLELDYTDRPVTTDAYYGDADLDRVLTDYNGTLSAATFFLPTVGLRCLRNLRRLASDRLLFLSGDKGYSRLDMMEGRGKPQLVTHRGCVSFLVNYHALARYVTQQQGEAHTPSYHPVSLTICAFLFGHPAQGFLETALAYRQAIADGGPSDFFGLKKAAEQQYAAFSLPRLIGYLRLSQWDANIFFGAYPTLLAHAEQGTAPWTQELVEAIRHIWQSYYDIGETRDIAFCVAHLLQTLGYDAEALELYLISLERHGPTPRTYYSMSLCHQRLGHREEAQQYRRQALALDPNVELTPSKSRASKLRPTPPRVPLPAGGYRLPIG